MNGLKIITHWCPSNILARDSKVKQFALIILNQPIKHLETFNRLWANATFRFCADGGSNRLYDTFKHDSHKLRLYLPDEIRGDLDSLRVDVKEYYESMNVKITRVADQDSTDFDKVIALLKEKEEELGKVFDIVALPALGGRFDQTMQSINVLYSMMHEVERRTILVSDESLTVLMDKGTHHIHCQPEYEGPTCGLIPIGAPATLTTRGLEWNLDHRKCHFGGMVSTSNSIAKDLIEVETDSPIVWTIEIKHSEGKQDDFDESYVEDDDE
ncbi:thiamine pyrophosphokinase [Zychaea mexicana]|uniref:thiamine pyrophosphokinase n=1 Tax=Zychaea mexicana TaxID=64656 RepID=UPI0022FDDCEB|nr:thiamine pyrophosphokinase [Zychaea mexicana]KAI9498320.1 thiamine pyrophosphokinase [Zychaea mexicana]